MKDYCEAKSETQDHCEEKSEIQCQVQGGERDARANTRAGGKESNTISAGPVSSQIEF
jgi:hypothetical protein